ncbi:hypothetical protein MAPG_05906 [Magnaporthiopsis poae ATCC 64411]|uniref:Biotrophy-associated secreted protein 2 n=1 Tax=Magnaporthiopsis poae (strain ATCC 64411 / 73-15) TaxID=644358 RepID=A0A0C4E0M5_MAGP6|nr:hypothetical protein MAPG_05906 [Magnaporthiopsis poae ATCC 64411]
MVRVSFFTALTMAASVLAIVVPNKDGAKNVGNGKGLQFITGGCLNNADCVTACCAGNGAGQGVCSAAIAANQGGKTGCGFVAKSKK